MFKTTIRGGATANVVLLLTLFVFVTVIAYPIASSLTRPDAPTFEPSPILTRHTVPDSAVVDTVTVDASDPEAWVFFSFRRRSVVVDPDTTDWDLAFRRFAVVPSGQAADLGAVEFDEVDEVPSEATYTASEFGKDTVNAALDRWYNYNMLSHLMSPKEHVYIIRTRSQHVAKIEFLSYYCPGTLPGCVTLHYTYQPDGSDWFTNRSIQSLPSASAAAEHDRAEGF